MVDLRYIKPNDLWYVIGLITADGNLSPDGRHISITSKDGDMLGAVKRALKIDNKISKKARLRGGIKKYYLLQLGDINFYRYLINIGLKQKKSLTLKSIAIPNMYFRDFLRGIIDGDGSISSWSHKNNKNIQWSLRIFSGSAYFTGWLKNKVEKAYKVNGRVHKLHKKDRNPIYTIKFGKMAAKVVINNCYYDNCLALRRKLKKAQECLRSENVFMTYGDVTAI